MAEGSHPLQPPRCGWFAFIIHRVNFCALFQPSFSRWGSAIRGWMYRYGTIWHLRCHSILGHRHGHV